MAITIWGAHVVNRDRQLLFLIGLFCFLFLCYLTHHFIYMKWWFLNCISPELGKRYTFTIKEVSSLKDVAIKKRKIGWQVIWWMEKGKLGDFLPANSTGLGLNVWQNGGAGTAPPPATIMSQPSRFWGGLLATWLLTFFYGGGQLQQLLFPQMSSPILDTGTISSSGKPRKYGSFWARNCSTSCVNVRIHILKGCV